MSKLSGLAAVLTTENFNVQIVSTDVPKQELVLNPAEFSPEQMSMIKQNIINNEVNAVWTLTITE